MRLRAVLPFAFKDQHLNAGVTLITRDAVELRYQSRPREATPSPEEVEDKARKALSRFIEENNKPAGTEDHKELVELLKVMAVRATEAHLARQERLTPPDLEKISDARRLVRQALETKQGLAETRQDIATQKLAALFRIEQGLKNQWQDQPRKPLTTKQKHEVTVGMEEAMRAAWSNMSAWKDAISANTARSEPYGDLLECEAGLDDAEDTRQLVSRIVVQADLYIKQLDRTAQQLTKNR